MTRVVFDTNVTDTRSGTAMQQILTGRTRLLGFGDDWERKRFGDICTFLSTANNPRADLEGRGDVGYIHYGTVHAHPSPVLDCGYHELPRIEEHRIGNASRLQDGDLVMVDASEDMAGLGKSVEVSGIGSDEIVSGLHTILCRGRSDHWAPGFKSYLQFIPAFRSVLTRIATGISVYAISRKQLADIVLALPSPSEQATIVTVLSDVDGLIESLEALIDKKRAVKTAAMQQLLTGRTRLPGFSGEWVEERLGDVAIFVKGRGLSKANISRDGTKPCIHYGELFRNYRERITNVMHGTDLEGDFVCSATNDVLMPTSDVTPNGLATASCIQKSGIILGGGILVIRILEDVIDGVFLAYSIRYHRDQVLGLVTGTTVYHLYGHDMAKFSCPAPNLEEQRAIVAVLSDIDAEIAVLERRLDKVRALKQGMMQQLLTGRTRLVKPS